MPSSVGSTDKEGGRREGIGDDDKENFIIPPVGVRGGDENVGR